MSIAASAPPPTRPPEIKVETIMTKAVHVITQSMTLRDAIKLLTEHKIAGAPIVDGMNNVISVMTEGDALKLAALPGGMDKQISKCMDQLCKTNNLITAKANDSFADVYKLFLHHGFHRVIVVDSSGKLHGLVSRSNVLRLLVESAPTNKEATTA
jgi:predicted transcriptional regulator